MSRETPQGGAISRALAIRNELNSADIEQVEGYSDQLVILVAGIRSGMSERHVEEGVPVNYKMRTRHKFTENGADAIYYLDRSARISLPATKWTKIFTSM